MLKSLFVLLTFISFGFAYSFYSDSAEVRIGTGTIREATVLADTTQNRQQINYEFSVTEYEIYEDKSRFQSCPGGNCSVFYMQYEMADYAFRDGVVGTQNVNGISTTIHRYTSPSGVVTTLYVSSTNKIVRVTQVGDSIDRTITFNTFTLTSVQFDEPPQCGSVQCNNVLDLILVIDSSGSISPEDYAIEKQYAKDVVNSFTVGNNTVKVGIVTFATEVFLRTGLTGNQTNITNTIENAEQQNGQTNIAGAIEKAHDEFRNNGRSNTPGVMIVVTDGRANIPPENAISLMISNAEAAKLDGILIYAIGVGDDVDQSDLEDIASTPVDDFTAHVSNFTALQTTLSGILAEVCTGGQLDSCNNPCSGEQFCGCQSCICARTNDDCVHGGTLNPNTCKCEGCDSGWEGDLCGECAFSCQNGGSQNADCSCTCTNQWSGSLCTECSLSCSEFGTEDPDNCRCNCQGNWSGPSCTTCTNFCNGNGVPRTACTECVCDGSYVPESNCQNCGLTCSGHGTEVNCACSCNNLWSGDNCETCNATCLNGGTLNTTTCTCSCPSGTFWTGNRCQTCRTSQRWRCSNQGAPDPALNCTCNCDNLYNGTTCNTCSQTCNSPNGNPNGQCSGCDCKFGWTPQSNCSICDATANSAYCNSRGFINNTATGCDTCTCSEPWTGSTCEICNYFCHNNGTSDDDDQCDSCTCFGAYTRESDCEICDASPNSTYCNGRGQISNENDGCNVCQCNDPESWEGDRCQTCRFNCHGHGEPVLPECNACDCDGHYDPNTACQECKLQCKNGGVLQPGCTHCECPGGYKLDDCSHCPEDYVNQCKHNPIGVDDNCECECSDHWSGSKCEICDLTDHCGSPEQGERINGTVQGEARCECACRGYWSGEDCQECSLEIGTRECYGIAEPNFGNCTCHCPDYYRDEEGCRECIIKNENCEHQAPGGNVNTDPDVCDCGPCLGGWEGRTCNVCNKTCDPGYNLTSACLCESVCGDGIITPDEECDFGNLPANHPNRECCVFCKKKSVPCNDKNACTITDMCNDNAVCEGIPVECSTDDPCKQSECVAGTCVVTPRSGSCDDGNLCTDNDLCVEGNCIGTPVDCEDGLFCTQDSCDPLLGCQRSVYDCNVDLNACKTGICDPVSDACVISAVVCDDNNACTKDSCLGSIGCIIEDISCDDGNVCTNDSCDTLLGCIHTNDALDCDDNNLCTTDTCHPVHGCLHHPIDCDDGDSCTTNTCVPDIGCVNDAVVCDDNYPCTVDFCVDGNCEHTDMVCSDEDDDLCTSSSCADGTCVTSPEKDCSDSDPCTVDSCVNGICIHEDIICEGPDKCTDSVCVDGTCVETLRTCPNQDAGCSIGTCNPLNGHCLFTPLDCNDNNACTNDYCDGGVCNNVEISCNDHLGCTTDECVDGHCVFTPVDCSSVDDCFAGSCVEPSGECLLSQIIDCNDNNACTSDSCVNGQCVNTESVVCEDDGNNCTVEYCDEETGECKMRPLDCDDSDQCTEDTCVEGECVNTAGLCVAADLSSSGTPSPSPSQSTTPTPTATPTPTPTTNGIAGAIFGGDGTGAIGNTVDNEGEVVLANSYSTLTVAGIGAAGVAFFAIFGAVIGFNNTKEKPETPLAALLETQENLVATEENPTYEGVSGPFQGVMYEP